MFITKTTMYVDDQNRRVVDIEIVCGVPPDDFVRFAGLGQMKKETPFGNVNRDFTVPLPRAKTLLEAFGMVDDEMEPAIEELKKKLRREQEQQSRIVLPTMVPPPELMGQGE